MKRRRLTTAALPLILAIVGVVPLAASPISGWAVGTFRGHGGLNNADIEPEISADANVVTRSWRPGGKQSESKGDLRDGKLVFNEESFYIVRRGFHTMLSRVGNPTDHLDLDRWN
ncbi:MAG: hypothetical protein KatS3mg024_1384 [Armatimonadota bacterium]|nr:MAG: hypothetical protein KatS3mg024_1384 [Armatimonadota bacterium]